MNLADLTATELARRIASGEIQAADAVDACLARIDAAEPDLHAWTYVDRDGARRTAEALDRHRRRGLPLGPLHGVPVGVKDIIDVAGMPGENGTPADAGRRPREDATVARRLRRAGAVILGKTATTPLAQGAPPAPTRNPHDSARTPGGSSAGSAAAVAAGMVPLAIGTQTNGSVIRPSSFCGIVGFKPSFGAIPRTGILPVSPSLDHVGVMARSVEDVALAEILTGADGRDADALPLVGPLSTVAASRPPVRPAIAFVPSPAWDQAEPSTREAFAELCEALGGIVDEVPLPDTFGRVFGWVRTIMAAEGAHWLGRYIERSPEHVDAGLAELVDAGRRTPAPDYLAARYMRGTLRAGLDEVLRAYDVILTPAAPGEAPHKETTGNPAFCSLWSFTGLPAVTLPLLSGPSGLPIGVQLVGAMEDDARLLRTARWMIDALAHMGEKE